MLDTQVIASSANVASETELLNKKYQQKELASIANVSRSSIGHYKTGERNMPADVMQSLTNSLNENIVARKMLSSFSRYVVPFADRIEVHPLIFSVIAEKEEREEEAHAEKVAPLLAKIKEDIRPQEKTEIKNYISELLDSVFIDNSLLATICDYYGFNLANLIEERSSIWREAGYLMK
ncbi:helix-turn-helix transcriptional regulator [Listeria aquatica]|uniref:Helix-turn-helix transcriptional regulator n=1 Tax=Listeria aquatica TaxID=1494960 RepID=A0A841ZPQ2_9LIST|nr:helix-turn-helix transcriptional regulator [Listeria aquatica]MBC1521432.1 helix-turn-helix transcriptional regulator [Listeria aquatica]